ncbi:adenosylcobinamide-phosphate synthase CbiB [Hydrogenophaga sp.]|uniref:adenosylcobinamide-phosphate synthase CbiB n=1 Tax=Hydrogenophaga sp. TaxID=1904254 RepID=UPI003565E358
MWTALSQAFSEAVTPGLAGPLAVLLALAVDRMFGEPAARWHPVVWMGAYLGWAGRRIAPGVDSQPAPPWPVFWSGACAWVAGAALVLLPTLVLVWMTTGWAWWWQALVLGLLLKPLLAWRMLYDEVAAVETALALSLPAGRERLSRLVSRDVAPLDDTQVRESAIETLAENLNDSVVAPLFWFAVAGLPGAAIYRFANTADAMWGYPGERQGRNWAWAGKWAARADDVLSWVPARFTALLLVLLGGVKALRSVPGEARRTPSPNSGWPMAAMALVLGLRLAKPGVYVLNQQGRAAQAADTARALRFASRTVWALAGWAALLSLPGLWRAAQ